VSVAGLADLENVFKQLRKGVANRIVRPGLAKAGRLAVKRVKAAIPSRFKKVRKAIKSKNLKTKYNGGVAGVKLGFGVGKKKSNARPKSRSKRKGVGIDYRNGHWIFIGTDHRFTGTARIGGHQRGRKNRRYFTGKVVRYTGRVDRQVEGVASIVRRSKDEIFRLIRTGIEAGIEKESARLARKRR
jgi:hypothetical protein